MTPTKITLPESDIPTQFYNIVADLRTGPPPPLHPGTREPIGPDMLAPIFPMALIAQEVSDSPAIEILEEVREIYRLYRQYPDPVIACHGGGSNFAGLAFPFLQDRLNGTRKRLCVIAAEPPACPSLTAGKREYEFGDTAGTTPLMMMHTLGHAFVPAPVHAGGLRYHGSAPLVSQLLNDGLIEAEAYEQREVFESALTFARAEATIPAPESADAVHSVVQHARKAREANDKSVILFNLSGHGIFDLSAYDSFLSGRMTQGA